MKLSRNRVAVSPLELGLFHDLFAESAEAVEGTRPRRVSALRERIARGEYRPNLELIAEHLVLGAKV